MFNLTKKPLKIPEHTYINIDNINHIIYLKGEFGNFTIKFKNFIIIVLDNSNLYFFLNKTTKFTKSYFGLFYKLINNNIIGISNKITKTLIMQGIGYKFLIDKNILTLFVGYSHPIIFKIPKEITLTILSPTKLDITGFDNEKVTSYSSMIRNIKPPEPYGGKGIRYNYEIIEKKVGKRAK